MGGEVCRSVDAAADLDLAGGVDPSIEGTPLGEATQTTVDVLAVDRSTLVLPLFDMAGLLRKLLIDRLERLMRRKNRASKRADHERRTLPSIGHTIPDTTTP